MISKFSSHKELLCYRQELQQKPQVLYAALAAPNFTKTTVPWLESKQ